MTSRRGVRIVGVGWDRNGMARTTGVREIDALLGDGMVQESEDLNLPPEFAFPGVTVDVTHRTLREQWDAGRVLLTSGAILERGHGWKSVWACTGLPDSEVGKNCNRSCGCCRTGGSGGNCDGQGTCSEHCPISPEAAVSLGLCPSRPWATVQD